MERLLPFVLANRILPHNSIFRDLYPVREVIKNEKAMYDYYAEVSKTPVENTKYAFWPARFESIFKRYNIDISCKSILDISGGPGYLTKYLSGKCKRVVVTEFSEDSVKGMSKNLAIDAVKYDYNTDRLDEIFKEQFDIVLIEYSINFCGDLQDFASRLYRIVSDKGFIYVTFVPPTLGCCLRWQHDQYTYNILYHPETIVRVFAQNGFVLRDRYSDPQYSYTKGYAQAGILFLLLRMPFIYLYKFKALNCTNSINRELIQKNIACVFTKGAL